MYITPNSPSATVQFRIKPRTILSVLGALVAVAVTIVFLTLGGANHATSVRPRTVPQAGVVSTSHAHYLGPQQTRPRFNPGVASGAAEGSAAHYTCLEGEQACLR